jgi:hypothetical protein
LELTINSNTSNKVNTIDKYFIENLKINSTETNKYKILLNDKITKYTNNNDKYVNDTDNFVKLYYQILDEYLRNINMKLPENKDPIFEYAYQLNIDNSKFIINVYSIKVNIETDSFIFYVIKYKFIQNDKDMGIFTAIYNIVTNDNKILETGQNEYYLNAGNYICKPVEYIIQTLVVGSDECKSEKSNHDCCSELTEDQIKINNTYKFIGNCSHNIYPLSEINFPDEIIIPDEKPNVSELYFPKIL